MTATTTTKKPRTSKKRRTKLLADGMDVDRVPAESRKQASCVLEVLAGLRTPEEVALLLGVSLPTYYNLETRALRGLVHGCTPEPPGRKQALAKRLRESEASCAELERQVRRYRALLRSAQSAAGVLAESSSIASKPGRKGRKPRVRALRAIEALSPSGESGNGDGNGKAEATS